MSIDELRAIIAAVGGDKHIWGFSFDGNGEIVFRPDNPFNSDTMIDVTTNCIRYTTTNDKGFEYTLWKPIATIFSVMTIDDIKNAFRYEPRNIFG